MKRVIKAQSKKKRYEIKWMIYVSIGLIMILFLSLYQKIVEEPYGLECVEVGTTLQKADIKNLVMDYLNERLWYDEKDMVSILFGKKIQYMVCCDETTLNTNQINVEVVFPVEKQYIVISLVTSSSGQMATEADLFRITDKNKLNSHWKDQNMKIAFYGELNWNKLKKPLYKTTYFFREQYFYQLQYYVSQYANQYRLNEDNIEDNADFTIWIKNMELYNTTTEACILYDNNFMLRVSITKQNGLIVLISADDLSNNTKQSKKSLAWMKKLQEAAFSEITSNNLVFNIRSETHRAFDIWEGDPVDVSNVVDDFLWNINGDLYYGTSDLITDEYIGQSIPFVILYNPELNEKFIVMLLKDKVISAFSGKKTQWDIGGDFISEFSAYSDNDYIIESGLVTIPEVTKPMFDENPQKAESASQIEQQIRNDVGPLAHSVTVYIGDANSEYDSVNQAINYNFDVYFFYDDTTCVECKYGIQIKDNVTTINKPVSTTYNVYTDRSGDSEMKSEFHTIISNISDYTWHDEMISTSEGKNIDPVEMSYAYSDYKEYFEHMKENVLYSFTIEADSTINKEVVQ